MSSKYNNNKKHGNVFKNWLCPSFLLLPKKSELPKLCGGCSPPRPPGPYAYVYWIRLSYDLKNYTDLRGSYLPQPITPAYICIIRRGGAGVRFSKGAVTFRARRQNLKSKPVQ